MVPRNSQYYTTSHKKAASQAVRGAIEWHHVSKRRGCEPRRHYYPVRHSAQKQQKKYQQKTPHNGNCCTGEDQTITNCYNIPSLILIYPTPNRKQAATLKNTATKQQPTADTDHHRAPNWGTHPNKQAETPKAPLQLKQK